MSHKCICKEWPPNILPVFRIQRAFPSDTTQPFSLWFPNINELRGSQFKLRNPFLTSLSASNCSLNELNGIITNLQACLYLPLLIHSEPMEVNTGFLLSFSLPESDPTKPGWVHRLSSRTSSSRTLLPPGCFSLVKRCFSSVQSLSHVWPFSTPWIAPRHASLSITNSRGSPKLMFIESVMPSSHLIFCCPLLLLPPIPPSIRVFSNESTLHMRWPKYWSFSFSIIPSKEIPGLISSRMDWLDLLAV